MTQQEYYASNWQFFNTLVTNVELSEDTLLEMFSNLKEDEIEVWAEEIRCCYVGADGEEDAQNIETAADLAHFYAKYPITE